MLKIGISNSKSAHWQAQLTQDELARVGVESEAVPILSTKIEDALLCGEVDFLVRPMALLPIEQAAGLLIAATSQRHDPADWLLVRPVAVEPGKILKFRTGGHVAVSSDRQRAQLSTFRPDANVEKTQNDPATQLEQLQNGAFDALVVAAADLLMLGSELAGFEAIKFNPREFLPAPAQGVLAWLALRDDLPTRRILQKIHRPETSACTNVERRALQLLPDALKNSAGIFCERDIAGYFHCFAVCEIDGELRRIQISQSTSAGLAERVAGGLMKS